MNLLQTKTIAALRALVVLALVATAVPTAASPIRITIDDNTPTAAPAHEDKIAARENSTKAAEEAERPVEDYRKPRGGIFRMYRFVRNFVKSPLFGSLVLPVAISTYGAVAQKNGQTTRGFAVASTLLPYLWTLKRGWNARKHTNHIIEDRMSARDQRYKAEAMSDQMFFDSLWPMGAALGMVAAIKMTSTENTDTVRDAYDKYFEQTGVAGLAKTVGSAVGSAYGKVRSKLPAGRATTAAENAEQGLSGFAHRTAEGANYAAARFGDAINYGTERLGWSVSENDNDGLPAAPKWFPKNLAQATLREAIPALWTSLKTGAAAKLKAAAEAMTPGDKADTL